MGGGGQGMGAPGGAGSSVPGGPIGSAGGIPGGAIRQGLVLDALIPGAGKEVVAKQFPGPTDFMRAYSDLQNASPELKPLAFQNLIRAAGDRYQLMRNGWAYDRVSGQWMHMPELGEGVTGTMDNQGNLSARVVPGAVPSISAIEGARAGAKAQYEPFDTYDQFGNEVVRPRTALADGGNPQGLSTGLPPGTTGAQAAAAPVPLAFKAAAGQSAQPKGMDAIKLEDIVPSGSVIPQRQAPPPGSFYGKPNAGITDMQKNDADRLATYNKQASEGQKIYQDLQMLDGTLQRGLNTNKLAPLWTNLTNVAQGLHMSGVIPKEYDPNDSGVFDKVATDLTFAALKQLPGQPRVAEIEGLQRANPNMVLPRATNAEIMHAILANQQWMDKRSDLATQYASKYPGAPLGYFDARFNAKMPLTDTTDQVFDAARKAGWQFPGDKGTPSNPATPSPFANDSRAQTIKQNYQKGMYGAVGSPEARAAAEKAYNAQ